MRESRSPPLVRRRYAVLASRFQLVIPHTEADP